MAKSTTVLPSAKRLINSLRDLGYETPEAIADLIDNSIAAGARNVDLTISFDTATPSIRIADDGDGISAGEINEAMRYGASRAYSDDDLGKFGLGLKTASMSQCRRLSVASRSSPTVARIEARQLDLAHIEKTNRWDILILGRREQPQCLVEPLLRRRGTVVLWEDLDRILPYKNPEGGWAARRLRQLAEDLELHLGMVFHRFIGGEVRGKRLRIRLNGNIIDPWDPFTRGEPHTNSLGVEDIPLNTVAGSGMVRLEPFILPPKASFSSLTAWRRASGPRNWNSQQGFYIYRANRLIQSGGWSGVRTLDEHTKLSRIALRFGPELDHAFDVNVAKMRVKLPTELRELISSAVSDAARSARAVYDAKPDNGSRRPRSPGSGRAGSNSSRTDPSPPSSQPGSDGGQTPGPAAPTDESGTGGTPGATARGNARAAIEAAAIATGESTALSKIIEALREAAPEVARNLGW